MTPTGLNKWFVQLLDTAAAASIITAGGFAIVCTAGTYGRATLKDSAGASLAQPVALSRGGLSFYAAVSVLTVDIYLFTPSGHCTVLYAVAPSGPNEVRVNVQSANSLWRIPFLGSDFTAAAENDLGIDLPAHAYVDPNVGIYASVAQGKTIDVGLLSSESGGDADGLMNDIDFTTAGVILAKSAATATRGALIGAGTLDRGFATDSVTSKSLSVTPASGTTTAAGLILLPVWLPLAA